MSRSSARTRPMEQKMKRRLRGLLGALQSCMLWLEHKISTGKWNLALASRLYSMHKWILWNKPGIQQHLAAVLNSFHWSKTRIIAESKLHMSLTFFFNAVTFSVFLLRQVWKVMSVLLQNWFKYHRMIRGAFFMEEKNCTNLEAFISVYFLVRLFKQLIWYTE